MIGRNAGNVDNFLIFDFANLTPVSGLTVTGAVLNFNVATGFSAGNHGSTLDTIFLSEIALGNQGWLQGNGVITGGDNVADDGSVSFQNQSQFDPAGVNGPSVPWVDSAGANVADLVGSFTQIGSQAGYNVGAAPAVLSFNVNAATAQNWVNNGLGGIALSVVDDGDTNARFNFQGNAGSIVFAVAVPEPGTGLVLSICGMMMLVRRNRS